VNDIKELTEALLKFRDERDWAQFHNPKDLALALNIEAGELLEAFLWKSSEQASPDKVKEELADVFAFALLLADQYGFDVRQVVTEKIAANALKYPVEKSRGIAKKYTEL
jgi:NTP pyrophosphatase (non-canonical NTP hydrolase)